MNKYVTYMGATAQFLVLFKVALQDEGIRYRGVAPALYILLWGSHQKTRGCIFGQSHRGNRIWNDMGLFEDRKPPHFILNHT